MNAVEFPQARTRAGVARGDITPPVGIYHRMWGAATHDRATGVHRPLLATVLRLQPEGDPGLVLVTLDHCIIDSAEMIAMRTEVAAITGLTPERVQIALSHTHGSGWMSRSRAHLPGGDLIGPYLDGMRATVVALARSIAPQPATIVYGTGRCSLARHRDTYDPVSKQFVCGFNPDGPADDTVLVARISGVDGRVLGTVVNYACHPTTLAFENTQISPDYVGAMREVIESATGGPCLFLQGASGDLGPREGFVGDPAIADRNGRELGYAAMSALSALPGPGTRLVYTGPVVSGAILGTWKHQPVGSEVQARQATCQVRDVTIPLGYRHDLPDLEETRAARESWIAEEARAAGDPVRARDCRARAEQMTRQITRLTALPPGKVLPYRVHLCRLGDAVWIFLAGELYQAFQVALRARFPRTPLFISTVTNDWQPGYLPSATSYGYGIYQDVIAAVAPGSMEVVQETLAREIETLR